MHQVMIATFLAAFLPALLAQQSGSADGGAKPPGESVEELIRLLGSQKFKERDEATRQLLQRKDAIPAVRQALKATKDREVARRLEFILRESAPWLRQRALERLQRLAKTGAVDQVAELLAPWPAGQDEAGCWHAVWDLARRLVELHRKQGGQIKLNYPETPWAPSNIVVARRLTTIDPRGFDGRLVFVRAGEVSLRSHPYRTLLVASGPVRMPELGFSALFVAGPVDVRDAFHSLIIAGEDVTLRGRTKGCLIIAQGTVWCSGFLDDSRVVSGGRVVVSGEHSKLENVAVKEKETMPLGFVRFFDPAREGVIVEAANGGVRVKAVDAKKPFAQAGLRVGDVITAVEGEAVDSPDTFRRLLRRALTVDEGCTLGVLRSGKTLEVRVPIPE